MSNKPGQNKKPRLSPQLRAQRMQRIFFVVLGVVMIITMIVSLIR